MNEIVSRRAFLAYGFIVSGTLLAEACAPKPLKPSNIIASLTPLPSMTPGPTKVSEPPLDSYPPIEAKGWAEKHKGTGPDKKYIPGTLDPERMYEFVGDWNLINTQGVTLASSKNRAIDLTWKGIGLVFVGDQDISQMSDVDRDAYRSYIADRLNTNQELKRQLNDITEKVPSTGQSTVAIKFVINGPEFSGLTAKYVDGLDENSNCRITGIAADIGSHPHWYKYDGKNLLQVRKDESPTLLPPVKEIKGRICRVDTGKPEMMRGLNWAEFRLAPKNGENSWEKSGFRMDMKIDEMKQAGGNFMIIGLDRTNFNNPGDYQDLAEAIDLARNKHGMRIMLSLSWDTSQQDEVIRVPTEQLPTDWHTFVNWADPSNNFIDSDKTFASFLMRNVDMYQMLGEPSGNISFFNPHMIDASNEVKKALGEDAITGISNGKWFATGAVELMFTGSNGIDNAINFNQFYPGSAAVIHSFKLDNWKYEKQDDDPLNDQRPDPMTYALQLMDKGVPIVIGECGRANPVDDDWRENPDWLRNLFDFCEANFIPYAIDGDLSEIAPIWESQKVNQ